MTTRKKVNQVMQVYKKVKELTNRLIKLMKKFVHCIINLFKRKRDESSRRTQEEEDQDNDLDWNMVIGGSSILAESYKKKDLSVEHFCEEKLKTDIVQETKGNNIIIRMNKDNNTVKPIQSVIIDGNKYMEYVSKDNVYGAVITVKFKGITLAITASHVVTLLPLDVRSKYQRLNPQLMIRTNTKKFPELIWWIRENDEVNWWTKNFSTNKHLYIVTNVTKPIVAHIKHKGRKRLSVIGIVVSIIPEAEYAYSGTLMKANGKPFVVTYIFKTSEDVVHIIALAVLAHDYCVSVESVEW